MILLTAHGHCLSLHVCWSDESNRWLFICVLADLVGGVRAANKMYAFVGRIALIFPTSAWPGNTAVGPGNQSRNRAQLVNGEGNAFQSLEQTQLWQLLYLVLDQDQVDNPHF